MYISASTAKMTQRLFRIDRLSVIGFTPANCLADRQHDGKLGALPRTACNPDVAAVVLDDAVGDRQSQAGPPGLGAEKRSEQFLQMLRQDAAAAVSNRNIDLISGLIPRHVQ